MKSGYLLSRRSGWRGRLLAVLLVAIGQLGIVGAALTLEHDEWSAISHAEQSGTNLHHGHNDAMCPSCTLLSLQGALDHAAPAFDLIAVEHVAFSPLAVERLSRPQLLTNSCRAPPREA